MAMKMGRGDSWQEVPEGRTCPMLAEPRRAGQAELEAQNPMIS